MTRPLALHLRFMSASGMRHILLSLSSAGFGYDLG